MSDKPSVLAKVADALTGMSPAWQRTFVVFLILVVGAIAGWIGRSALTGPPADAATMTIYKDWKVICPGNKAKKRTCEMVADVFDTKSGQRMASLSVSKEKDKKEPTLYVMAPLGVLIPPGVVLRLDSEQQKPYPYKTCTMEGCIAMVPFDKTLVGLFKDASDGALTVGVPGADKSIDVNFSLKGFNAAYAAYGSGEAKRKSWFWRLWL